MGESYTVIVGMGDAGERVEEVLAAADFAVAEVADLFSCDVSSFQEVGSIEVTGDTELLWSSYHRYLR